MLALRARALADHGDDLFEREKVELTVSGFFRLRGDLLNNLDLDRGTTPSGQPLFPVPLGDPTGQTLFGSDMRLRTDVAIYAPFAAAAVKIRADLIDNLVLGSHPGALARRRQRADTRGQPRPVPRHAAAHQARLRRGAHARSATSPRAAWGTCGAWA